jgi:transcriptional regulator with XRE-family HTH domain
VTELAIGERIRALRKPAFTQHDLAAAADVSVDVIRKLEQGRWHTASSATLARIARVLGVDVAELLGPSRPVVVTSGDRNRVVAILDALTSVDGLLGELDDAEVPNLTELRRTVTYCFGLYWAGRYGQLAALLPGLLTEAAAALHGAAAAEAGRVADVAAQVPDRGQRFAPLRGARPWVHRRPEGVAAGHGGLGSAAGCHRALLAWSCAHAAGAFPRRRARHGGHCGAEIAHRAAQCGATICIRRAARTGR